MQCDACFPSVCEQCALLRKKEKNKVHIYIYIYDKNTLRVIVSTREV